MVKDEAHFISEWIAFHAIQGICHFYIYDNGSSDALDVAVQNSGFAERVTLIHWPSFHMKVKILAHNHALASFGSRHRWVGFLDVDEFVFAKNGAGLEDTFANFEEQPVLSLPWHMFGSSEIDVRPSGLVIDNYIKKSPFPPQGERATLLNWKSFVDPTAVAMMNIHAPCIDNLGATLMNERGQKFSARLRRCSSFAVSETLQLNHYYSRSEEDFESKISKGRAAKAGLETNEKRLREVKQAIEAHTVVDVSAQGYSNQVRQALCHSDVAMRNCGMAS